MHGLTRVGRKLVLEGRREWPEFWDVNITARDLILRDTLPDPPLASLLDVFPLGKNISSTVILSTVFVIWMSFIIPPYPLTLKS